VTQNLVMVIRRYGGPYDPKVPLEEQVYWEAHRAFMNALEAGGVRAPLPVPSGAAKMYF
jgi:hypothetical protein